MSTHIVACLMLYRHRQVRLPLCIMLLLPMALLCFFFSFCKETHFILFLCATDVASLLQFYLKTFKTKLS